MNEWQSEPISRYCEVFVRFDKLCYKPTTHAYPAMGKGYFALCSEHAKKHPEAWPIQEIDEILTK